MDSQDAPRVTTRPARLDDVAWIAESNRRMALETEGRELAPGVVERGVRGALEDPERGRYTVAELDGRPAGCLLVTREWSDWRNGWFWWIQSVYVDVEARGHGLFRALYQDVLRRARDARGVCGVRLYVERENGRARDVYRHLGMSETSYRLYEVDFGADPARG